MMVPSVGYAVPRGTHENITTLRDNTQRLNAQLRLLMLTVLGDRN